MVVAGVGERVKEERERDKRAEAVKEERRTDERGEMVIKLNVFVCGSHVAICCIFVWVFKGVDATYWCLCISTQWI